MWGMIDDMMGMMPRRRTRGNMNTITAMLLGAGIGITTWEMMRRRNAAGNTDMTKLAQSVMEAVKE